MKFFPNFSGCITIAAIALALSARSAEEQAETTAAEAATNAVAESAKSGTSVSSLKSFRLDGSSKSADADKKQVTVKALDLEGVVIPPSAEEAPTLADAVRSIMDQAKRPFGSVGTNGVDKLVMPYQQLGDGRSSKVKWRDALRQLLLPVGYSFVEDEDLVLFGLESEVDQKHKMLVQERLHANHTPILFSTNGKEGGMELLDAIRHVSMLARVTISTDYMDPKDLYAPPQQVAAPGQKKEAAKAATGAAAQKAATQNRVKHTTFDTNGQHIEWRTVLREILNPHGYDFKESGGVVRIASYAKLAQWEKETLERKPLTAKVIRLYHADPELVVSRLQKIKGLLAHPNASLQATRDAKDNADTVENLNARVQTSGGKKSGMSDTTSQVFQKLTRPRTVPAIIVYDIEENIPKVEKKIKLFDIKEKQVLIEAIIFELDSENTDGGDIDGIQWSGFEKFTPLAGSFGNSAYIWNVYDTYKNTKPAQSTFNAGKARNLFIRTDGFDFETVIQLIRERSNSKLLSSPMLVIGDHSEAAIQASDIMPVLELTVTSQKNGDTIDRDYSYEWNMVKSGVLMWVSPEITERGDSVRLTVHPQVVTRIKDPVIESVPLLGEVKNYELMMHEMDTRATVPSGATLMFGGLIDNQEIEVEDKVRILGDLPGIGWFFRSKTTTIVQKNLIIMIRPTILDDGDETGFENPALKESESVAANSGRNLKKTEIGGPYSLDEVKKTVKSFVKERFIKPFKSEKKKSDAETELEEAMENVESEEEDESEADERAEVEAPVSDDAEPVAAEETEEVAEPEEIAEPVVAVKPVAAKKPETTKKTAKKAPVIEEPVVEEPVVEDQSEEPLVEEHPEAPAVKEQAEELAVEETVAEEPASEEPAAEESAAEESVAEEPAAEEPPVEESVAEEPAVEEQASEETAAEEPAAEEPAVEESAEEQTAEPEVEEQPVEEPEPPKQEDSEPAKPEDPEPAKPEDSEPAEPEVPAPRDDDDGWYNSGKESESVPAESSGNSDQDW